MNKNSKIYVAGHKGLVGSAFLKKLKEKGYTNIVCRTSKELDLRIQSDVDEFFKEEQPEYVFLAAAKVGGILANSTYRAEFIYDNVMISTNIINTSYKYGVKKLMNLGSSCIYPKLAPQPLKEEYLLTGELEPTNAGYAIAKISAIKMCRYYNEQYGTNFISAMPTNLYGPNDNFDLETSHVLPAMLRKFHLAKLFSEGNWSELVNDLDLDIGEYESELKKLGITKDSIELWGTGTPYREFFYVEDMADACLFLMERCNYEDIGEFVNMGTGKDLSIKDLAYTIKEIVGYEGDILFDSSKPDGTPKKLLDVSRLNELGWNHTVELEDGIKRMYDWYKEVV